MKTGIRQQARGNSKRIKLFGLVPCAMLFALCSTAATQQTQKVPRVGFLIASNSAASTARIPAFRDGLRELGYVEGKNIILDIRYADGKLDRLPALAAELVAT